MKPTIAKIAIAVAVALLLTAGLHALSQPNLGGGGGFGGGGPMMMGPGGPPPFGGPPGGPTPVVVVSDGVVYVACDGKLIAFEAKTLKKLAEATYWERPQPPDQNQ